LKSKKLLLYTDGASRGNPGPAGIGVVILDSKRKKLKELSKYIGETTNNVAEYSALICALEEAQSMAAGEVVIYMDSELMTRQLTGEYRVKSEEIRPLFEKALGLLKKLGSFEIKHIERAKNKDADRLANRAVNLASLF
jgi:ribonuclease HI